MSRAFLIMASLITVLVALGYGAAPHLLLPMVMDFGSAPTDITTDIAHVFRAIMGLYLMLAAFWLWASFKPELYRLAITIQILFMGGLALGRLLSIALDGMPSNLLAFYTLSEIGMAATGLLILAKTRSGQPSS